MIKLLGVALVSVSVAVFGFVKSSKYTYRKRYISAFLRFSETAVQLMSSYKKDLFSIFGECAEKELRFLNSINHENITDVEAVKCILLDKGVFEADIEPLADFLTGLGKSDIDGQRLHCRLFCENFKTLLKSAEADVNEKAKLQKQLYLLLSAAIFIIFI